jgi:hypothetical protein
VLRKGFERGGGEKLQAMRGHIKYPGEMLTFLFL